MVVDRQGSCGGDGKTVLPALLDKLSLTTVMATHIAIWVCWIGAGLVTYAFFANTIKVINKSLLFSAKNISYFLEINC